MEPKQFLNRTVSQIVGVKEVKGDKIGIELELEGRNVALPDVATKGWGRHHDGSLRGESIEYTTTGAQPVDKAKELVAGLFKKFEDNGVKFNESLRTSTHVHLNFSDKPVKYAINFFTLFTLLEEVLQHYSGEDRKGNLFCISTREAEGIVNVLMEGVAKSSLNQFAGDRYKYSACNLSTLFKFGTVEIRTMRGASSTKQVNSWIDILNDMYVYSCTQMESPASLIRDLSYLGAMGLMRSIFRPENLDELLSTFPNCKTLHYSLMEGARVLQVFAWTFDEDFKAKVDLKNEAAAGGRLPTVLQVGMFAGRHYVVWKPDGRQWHCVPSIPGVFWQDGDHCSDDANLVWNENIGRFVYTHPVTGRATICNWAKHHDIPDEGPMLIEEEEVEMEQEFDENDDEEDDF